MADRRRCTIFNNSNPNDGKVVLLPNNATMSMFLQMASEKLGIKAKLLYTENGAEIDDILLIRDNDLIFVSAGEAFAAKEEAPKVAHTQVYQIAVMGPGSVGKSAMTLQYVQGVFVMDYDPTIEDAYRKPVDIDGQSCILDILDTAGQEDYIALRSTWMRERDGFLLVFSVTDRGSFDGLGPFHDQLEEMHEDKMPPVIIVGNKADKPPEEREVKMAEGHTLAEEFNAVLYIETSAKTGQNIDRTFATLVRAMRKQTPSDDNKDKEKKTRWCTLL